MKHTTVSTYDTSTVTQWLDGMLGPLKDCLDNETPTAVVGIRRGGVVIARYLLDQLAADSDVMETELGELNIAFYRDDFSSIGLHPVVGPSQVPFDVNDRHIILVDDVLASGRTVRAAMNEIFDYGRPSRITLAVLVQRIGHELPIRADVIGETLDVQPSQYIDLDTETLQLRVGERQ